MAPRLELQALLVDLLGSKNVYFQPPPTIQLQYPCIIYKRSDIDTDHANNKPYRHKVRYQLTYMDRSPDNNVTMKIASLPTCSFDRFYTSDGLNHDVFKLYF